MEAFCVSKLTESLDVYNRQDLGAAIASILAVFVSTSTQFFCREMRLYVLLRVDLKQKLTFVVAIKSEVLCMLYLLIFAGMNDHMHATGLLEKLMQKKSSPEML